jgi:DNA-directed RNA polymerase subunit RPC12/RpoP
MQCSNCKTEISMMFKHSFLKNECPACGQKLMADDTLKIIEDLKATILEEVNIKEESADKLSMALITKYNISFGNNDYVSSKIGEQGVKVYGGSKSINRISSRGPIISAEDMNKEDISDAERDKILEEALMDKYQDISMGEGVMLDEYDPDLVGPNIDVDESMISRLSGGGQVQGAVKNTSAFSEGAINPYAEQKRLESLRRQRENISSGAAKIKRA